MPQLKFLSTTTWASEYLFYVKRRARVFCISQNDKDHQEHTERFYLDAALKQQAQNIHDIFQLWSSYVHLSQQPPGILISVPWIYYIGILQLFSDMCWTKMAAAAVARHSTPRERWPRCTQSSATCWGSKCAQNSLYNGNSHINCCCTGPVGSRVRWRTMKINFGNEPFGRRRSRVRIRDFFNNMQMTL